METVEETPVGFAIPASQTPWSARAPARWVGCPSGHFLPHVSSSRPTADSLADRAPRMRPHKPQRFHGGCRRPLTCDGAVRACGGPVPLAGCSAHPGVRSVPTVRRAGASASAVDRRRRCARRRCGPRRCRPGGGRWCGRRPGPGGRAVGCRVEDQVVLHVVAEPGLQGGGEIERMPKPCAARASRMAATVVAKSASRWTVSRSAWGHPFPGCGGGRRVAALCERVLFAVKIPPGVPVLSSKIYPRG